MPDIQLRNLTKRFGSLTAVDGIDLNAEHGEMLTLLGPSGCGKTTTLRMVAGLETPDEGTIHIGEAVAFDGSKGIDVPAERRNLGMVFQSYAIWPHMTVFENVSYPLRMRSRPKKEINERVGNVLKLVGLDGMEDKSATKLSGGQQQRVALARSLVFEPRLLLLDEPLSNLDAKLREHMRVELRVMQKRLGVTALYVTHDQEEALTLSDRLIVMNQGAIEQIGTPREVYECPATRFVAEFMGKANLLDLDGKPEALDGGGFAVLLPGFNGTQTLRLGKEAIRTNSGDGAHCLFIRPEKIRIAAPGAETAAGEAMHALRGKVRARTYVGDHYEYLVAINEGMDLRVTAGLDEQWAEGAEVELIIAGKDMFLYA
ncbi:MAG: ABC transporter ATP-binding protein [Proteobacteria bacterium]|nr:ABC transporter ATP-binding protein [Pseudomonadota bacterium]